MASTQTKKKNNKKPVVSEQNKLEESILVTMAEEKEKKKKPGNEIDEIFRGKKAKRPKEFNESKEGRPSGTSELKKKEEKRTGEEGSGNNKRKTKMKGATVVENGPGSKAKRRRTAEGLAIYTEDELGIGNGDAGGTPLCPFDCSCCF